MSTKDDNRKNRKQARGWLRLHAFEYETSTQAAQAYANQLHEEGDSPWDEDDEACTIPEYIFEEAANFE